jgi:DNA-binding NarL/FixJ family response regulator
MEQKIRVAVYEDNAGLREILASIIRESAEFELAGEFGHCLDAIKNTEAYKPDVILMDIDLPGKSGIEAVRDIKGVFPGVEIIMNTVFDDDDRVFRAIQAGATGYLLKKNSLATLLNSIKDVKAGGAPMSPGIARQLLSLPWIRQRDQHKSHDLSDREMQILEKLSKGLSYKMVAEELHISIDTVRSYIKRMYEKLHVHSVTEAIHKVFIDKK